MLPAGFMSPYLPPPGFKFPQPNDYVSGLVNGLKSVQSDALSTAETSLIAPVKLQVSTTVAVLEGATGVSIADVTNVGSAIMAIANSGKASDVLKASSRLVDGTLALVSDVLKAANVSTDAAGAIPIIGSAIGIMIKGIVEGIMGPALVAQQQQACDQALAQSLDKDCADWLSKSRVVATDRLGAVPADLFRPLAYGMEPTGVVPPCMAAVYAAICAPEARGTWAGAFNAGTAGPDLAPRVPAATKRKMWALIEAILAAVEDPLSVPIGTDGGRSAYPALQSFVWTEKEAGRLTYQDVYNCANYIGQSYRLQRTCRATYPVAGTFFAHGDCGERVAQPLADAFWATIVGFRNQMYAQTLQYTDPNGATKLVPWYEASSRTWNLPSGVGGSMDQHGMVGVVTLPAATTSLLVSGHSAVQLKKTLTGMTISGATGMPTWEKGVLAATGLSAGFLSYLGVRKLAHGVRR